MTPPPPKVALIASIVAFANAALGIVGAVFGSIIALPLAAIPLAAGIGIIRRRSSFAYGFAVYAKAQIAMLIFVTARAGASISAEALIALILMGAVAILFWAAGRALTAAGSAPGSLVPWLAVSVATVAPFFFLQAFAIPTGAMEDTILIGDRILVLRFPKTTIHRDELVVIRYPVDPRQTFIKRVIGVPGDRIRIANKVAYRNGVAINEPYAVHKTEYVDTFRDSFPSTPNIRLLGAAMEMLEHHVINNEVIVPPGKYFVLGDNRDSSLDSRYWGFVDYGGILGKPLLIYDSIEPAETGSSGRGGRTR